MKKSTFEKEKCVCFCVCMFVFTCAHVCIVHSEKFRKIHRGGGKRWLGRMASQKHPPTYTLRKQQRQLTMKMNLKTAEQTIYT